MSRRILTGIALAASLVAVPGTATAASAPSSAAPAPSAQADCSFSNTLCLFDEAGFGGTRFTVSSASSAGVCVDLVEHGWGGGRVKSAINTHSTSAALFPNEDCTGGPYQVAANASISDLGTFAPVSVWVPGS